MIKETNSTKWLQRVKIILKREEYDNIQHQVTREYVPVRPEPLSYITMRIGTQDWIIPDPTVYTLRYENLSLLLRTFETISHINKDRKRFFEVLRSYLDHKECGDLALETLIKCGSLDKVLYYYDKKPPVELVKLLGNRLDRITSLLQMEHNLFSINDLEKITGLLSKMYTIFSEFTQKNFTLLRYKDFFQSPLSIINRILWERTKAEILALPNSQINEDKIEVKKKISHFGFPPQLATVLERVEEYYWSPQSCEFDYSAALGKLREFLASLIKHVCLEIKKNYKGGIPNNRKI